MGSYVSVTCWSFKKYKIDWMVTPSPDLYPQDLPTPGLTEPRSLLACCLDPVCPLLPDCTDPVSVMLLACLVGANRALDCLPQVPKPLHGILTCCK